MDSNVIIQKEELPALTAYEDIAGRMEHSLTQPDLNEEQTSAALLKARSYGLAAVMVRPSDVDIAVRILDGSSVRVASVAGFPHGTSTTATKLYEGRDLLRRGAREVSLVVHPGKMKSRQFQHVETEILQMSESCHQADAVLKVVFETSYLAEDLKIILCKMCKRTEADYAETDTGYGPGVYATADLALLKTICKDIVKIKATVSTLAEVHAAFAAGAERFGSLDAFAILDAWKAELEARAKTAAVSE